MAPLSLQPSHSCQLNYSSIQEVVSRHPAIIWTQFGRSEVMPKSYTLRVVWWGRSPALSPPSSYAPCLEWDDQGIFSSQVLLLALVADGNLGIETALKMEKSRDVFLGRVTSTLLLEERKSSDSQMMQQRSRLVAVGGFGDRETEPAKGCGGDSRRCWVLSWNCCVSGESVIYVKKNCVLETHCRCKKGLKRKLWIIHIDVRAKDKL